MKIKSLLILSFHFFFYSLTAQDYTPFPTSGAVWTETETGADRYLRNYEISIRATDSVVDGKTYKVFNKKTTSFSGAIGAPRSNLFLLREENKKIFVLFEADQEERMIYNFDTLRVGDSINKKGLHALYSAPYAVAKIDSIKIGTTFRKRYMLTNTSLRSPLYWFEGIGSSNGLVPFYLLSEATVSSKCFFINNIGVNISRFQTDNSSNSCVSSTSENAENLPELSFTPNPMRESGFLELPEASFADEITVSNLIGKALMRLKVSSPRVEIKRDNLPSGFYVASVFKKGRLVAKAKFIVE